MNKIKHTELINRQELWEEFQHLCRKLHLPVLEANWEFQVAVGGKLIEEPRKERAGSYLRNFYNFITSQTISANCTSTTLFGPGELSFRNTAGTKTGTATSALTITGGTVLISWSCEGVGAGFRAAAGDNTYGIQAGTASTAVTFENYVLTGLIANGIIAGTFSYQAMVAPGKEWINDILKYNVGWERYMNNNSGGDITVNEVGLTAKTYTYNYEMMERHVISGGLLVPDTAQLLCKYSLGLTFP